MDEIDVKGAAIDEQTRCEHWDSQLDVVAFRFPCCQAWYPCRTCHDGATDHATETWGPSQLDEQAVLCGVCRHVMPIEAYTASGHACPSCGTGFNPGCQAHWSRYFQT